MAAAAIVPCAAVGCRSFRAGWAERGVRLSFQTQAGRKILKVVPALDRDSIGYRSECLRKNGFRGLLVFCPGVREEAGIAAACRRAGDLAAMYAARF